MINNAAVAEIQPTVLLWHFEYEKSKIWHPLSFLKIDLKSKMCHHHTGLSNLLIIQ